MPYDIYFLGDVRQVPHGNPIRSPKYIFQAMISTIESINKEYY